MDQSKNIKCLSVVSLLGAFVLAFYLSTDHSINTDYLQMVPGVMQTDKHRISKYGASSYDSSSLSRHQCPHMKEEVTVVTAFFYIGSRVAKAHFFRSAKRYFRWMTPYKLILNPVVAYFNREEDAEYFAQLRQHLGQEKTKVIILNQTDMWAFRLRDSMQENMAHSPMLEAYKATPVLQYASSQHAKYEVVRNATIENWFCTRYIMWLDIGYYLDLLQPMEAGNCSEFRLWIPKNYNESCVAYTAVRRREAEQAPRHILINGGCWLGGGAFLANVTLMKTWVENYMGYVQHLARDEVIFRTDQETLYSWMNGGENVLPVQAFSGSLKPGGTWRHLGYLCKLAGENGIDS